MQYLHAIRPTRVHRRPILRFWGWGDRGSRKPTAASTCSTRQSMREHGMREPFVRCWRPSVRFRRAKGPSAGPKRFCAQIAHLASKDWLSEIQFGSSRSVRAPRMAHQKQGLIMSYWVFLAFKSLPTHAVGNTSPVQRRCPKKPARPASNASARQTRNAPHVTRSLAFHTRLSRTSTSKPA